MNTTVEDLDLNELTVAEVALTFPHSLKELNRYKLDFCCGGKKSFIQACRAAGVDPESIMKDLAKTQSDFGADNRMNFVSWDVPLLIDFIVQHHHTYVKDAIPKIEELLNKVCEVHGNDSQYLIDIRRDFSDLRDELLKHLPKEEKIIFPAIREMFVPDSKTSETRLTPYYLVEPLCMAEQEHERAGELIHSIRKLSNNYSPPAHACPTFRMTYFMLQQFDDDLMQHIHLENNILFAKVKANSEAHKSL